MKYSCARALTAELVTDVMLFLTITTHNGLLIVHLYVLKKKN